MKKIYLLRHAKAKKAVLEGDFQRPLNKKGKNDLKKLFEHLKAYKIGIDRIVCSPAKRTRQTAELFAKFINFNAENIAFKDEIYSADASVLFNNLKSVSNEFNEVLLVGHNPALLELCELLSPLCLERFSTSSLLCLEFDIQGFDELKAHSGKPVFFEIVRLPKSEI